MAHTISIIVYEGCFGSAALGLADLFGVANTLLVHQGRAVAFDVQLLSLTGGHDVRAAGDHIIRCDGMLADREPNKSTLLLPGMDIGSAKEIGDKAQEMAVSLQVLRDWHAAGSRIAANCSATFLLAASGLLEGRRATTSWWLEDMFRKAFGNVSMEAESILVEDDRLITAAAGTSYLDLALHVIGVLEGPKLASLCAHFMVIDGGRSSQRPYTVPWHFKSRDPMIERADGWIRGRLAEKIRISDMAQYLGVEPRTMNRRFRKTTGQTPQAYVKRARMDRAKMQLETTQESIAAIGDAVGYEDENAFRRAFIADMGVTPAQYRRQFKRSAS